MNYHITHRTQYRFSEPVFLEPHLLRFRAQQTPFQQLEEFHLTISPQPSGHRQQRDAENNLVDSCWFEGLHDQLQLVATSVVSVVQHNPFDFILYPADALSLPFAYAEEQLDQLAPALQAEPIGQELLAYGRNILREQKHNTTLFLTELTRRIQADFTVVYRETGSPLPPDQTLTQRRGSCRDLSWMMIHLLRQLGLATRFVSGYNYILTTEEPVFELHAWVEVFLPGAGWVGYDPTHGIAVGNAHVPIAASTAYAHTMPVSGKLRGAAKAKLTTELQIERR